MPALILETDCELLELSDEQLIEDFDCGDSDINDFFNHDAILYQQQRLGKTYYFRHKQTGKIVCAYSLSADSLKTVLLPNNRRKKVKERLPREKLLQSYPTILIGRLGVSAEFANMGIGSQLMEKIKFYCFYKFEHLVRFLVVDAYNKSNVLNYYVQNGFGFVFSTEQQEMENLKKTVAETDVLHTRQMFYDLTRW
jgi:GNAT superfamily N-acetyltransferase